MKSCCHLLLQFLVQRETEDSSTLSRTTIKVQGFRARALNPFSSHRPARCVCWNVIAVNYNIHLFRNASSQQGKVRRDLRADQKRRHEWRCNYADLEASHHQRKVPDHGERWEAAQVGLSWNRLNDNSNILLFSEIFDLFNARSLDDEEFTASLVFVITSRQMDSFMVNGKILRHAMVSILQKNFQNADNFKRDNMEKFYNSIKLLGEYFNKARLSNGVPINIIGQSLLNLINVELEKELRNICHLKGEDFAKLVLSQVNRRKLVVVGFEINYRSYFFRSPSTEASSRRVTKLRSSRCSLRFESASSSWMGCHRRQRHFLSWLSISTTATLRMSAMLSRRCTRHS